VVDRQHRGVWIGEQSGWTGDRAEPFERSRDLIVRTDVTNRRHAKCGHLLDVDVHGLASLR
jgi:hypothetical protein